MAKYVFPAIFVQESDGSFSVSFPDIESCYTQGDNLQDAYQMAEDVLCLCLYKMEEANENIPKPSNPKNIQTKDSSFVAIIELTPWNIVCFMTIKQLKDSYYSTMAQYHGRT